MLKIGICGLSVVTAAILGIRTGSRIPERLKAYMMSVLSILCFIVAITSIQKYADLLPVALALICGGILEERRIFLRGSRSWPGPLRGK